MKNQVIEQMHEAYSEGFMDGGLPNKITEALLAGKCEIERLRAALKSIAVHNHAPQDEFGNVIIMQSDCPACEPRTTARNALFRDKA